MSNKPKIKGQKKPGIQKRISSAYARFAGTLPASVGLNQDALTGRTVCEGSIEVSLGLLAEAERDGDTELETALRGSLATARDRLNALEPVIFGE